MVVVQPEVVFPLAQGHLALEGLHAAPVLGRQHRYLAVIDDQVRAVGLEVERVFAGRGQFDPALEADRHVVMDALQIAEREVGGLAGAFGLDRLMADAFPDLSAVHRVVQVAGYARLAQEVMRDAFEFAARQTEVGHASRGAAQVGLTQKVDQAAETVLLFQGAQRDRRRGQRFTALGVARRVAGRATAGVEELFALGGGDRVGRLRRKR